MKQAALLLLLLAPLPAAAQRPALEGSGDCAGVTGRYLASLAGGTATVLSAAEFPGGRAVSPADLGIPSPTGALWRMTVPGFVAQASGCLAFDKDRFTWPGDLATYVQYLVRELLVPAQQLDPALRTLTVRERTVRLEVQRAQQDTAVIAGPEGAMLGYGRLDDPERYFFLPVLLDDGDTVLVRILRNQGAPFGEHATLALGVVLLRGGDWAATDLGPGFRLRRVEAAGEPDGGP
jgi:hypothetical protein